MPKLTKTLVDNTKPTTSEQFVWDSDLPGFGLRVSKAGRKTYIVRYRTRDGIQRKQKLARASDMPPDRARDMARKVFASVAEGLDPLQARYEEKNAPTIEDLKERYMREHAKPFKKPRSQQIDESNWRLHILPVLGSRKAASITKADILTLHGSLSETPGVANQVLALLSKSFNLCEDWDWRPQNSNPCSRVRKYELNERELILEPDQIRKLGHALDELEETYQISQSMACLIRLLMLTGCRLNEIMSAERAWVDRERSMLILPDSKTGRRRIPLSQAALDIIDELPEGKWLIPGRNLGDHLKNPHKVWKRILKHAGLPLETRIHDLRHTAGSLAHDAGLSQKQIQILLGHKQASTTERYLHGRKGDGAKVVDTLAGVITSSWARTNHPAPETVQ